MIKTLKHIILLLISFIEVIEYRNIDLDQDDVSKKILNSIELNNINVWTDTGWEPLSHVHITQPYTIWKIDTDDGLSLECADKHKVFDINFNIVFVEDLKLGDLIQTINGLSRISNIETSLHKVSMFDVTVDHDNHRFYSNGILSSNTICSSIFIAWYILFNFDKNALILSNKGATTTEILDKGKTILENLPFFMKPGVLKYDVFNSKFDNGCRIIGQTTTKKAAIGFTIHLLFMDEFAHIPHQFIDVFYENVYPTVSASKNSKVIITSTPWGFNKFYEIYTAAEKGLSEYKPFRIDWWDVPGRDDEWMEAEIQNLGSEEAFNRQYGNQFISSSSLLLSPDSLKRLQQNQIEYVHRDIPELDDESLIYSDLKWHPNFSIEDEAGEDSKYWLFSIDIAEGNGGDYSVINIFQVNSMALKDLKKVISPGSMVDFFGLYQVGRFRSNEHSIDDFAKVLYVLIYDVFNQENVKLLIEWNVFGSELMKRLETVFPQRNDFDEESVTKFKHRIDARTSSYGLKVKSDNKPIFCQNFKKGVAQNRIVLNDKDTVKESSTFGKMANGRYSGQNGNDDLVMTAVNASEFLNTVDFTEYVEELYDFIDEAVQAEIENILERDLRGGNLNYDIYDLV